MENAMERPASYSGLSTPPPKPRALNQVKKLADQSSELLTAPEMNERKLAGTIRVHNMIVSCSFHYMVVSCSFHFLFRCSPSYPHITPLL